MNRIAGVESDPEPELTQIDEYDYEHFYENIPKRRKRANSPAYFNNKKAQGKNYSYRIKVVIIIYIIIFYMFRYMMMVLSPINTI